MQARQTMDRPNKKRSEAECGYLGWPQACDIQSRASRHLFGLKFGQRRICGAESAAAAEKVSEAAENG